MGEFKLEMPQNKIKKKKIKQLIFFRGKTRFPEAPLMKNYSKERTPLEEWAAFKNAQEKQKGLFDKQ
jgi:hypothetical protein